MQAADQVRLRYIQLVIAPVDEDAFSVEKSAHGAVTENRRAL